MHILLTNLWGKLLYHDLHWKTLSNSHKQLAQQTYEYKHEVKYSKHKNVVDIDDRAQAKQNEN